jgi:hypothetical protein
VPPLALNNQPTGAGPAFARGRPLHFNPTLITTHIMIYFKILKATVRLLPWLLVAILLRTFWPLISVALHIGHGIHHLFQL